MHAFEVLLNDERLCVAGSDDLSIVNVTTSIYQFRREPINPGTILLDEGITFHVGGLEKEPSSRHVVWAAGTLLPGERLRIGIVDVETADQVKEIVELVEQVDEQSGKLVRELHRVSGKAPWRRKGLRARTEYAGVASVPRLACEVFHNGRKLYVAGVHLGCVDIRIGAFPKKKTNGEECRPDDGPPRYDSWLCVYGGDKENPIHSIWANYAPLSPGDVIDIHIIESEAFDPPLRRTNKKADPLTMISGLSSIKAI